MFLAQERLAPFVKDEKLEALLSYCRINILRPEDAQSLPHMAIPMLFMAEFGCGEVKPKRHHYDDVIAAHVHALTQIQNLGFSHAAVACDEDGVIHKLLSPRFSPETIEIRAHFLVRLFLACRKVCSLDMVLVVEELIMGGLDATDGIFLAQALHDAGLDTIIATQGTKDFLPLYLRKNTQKKPAMEHEFSSHEPDLASAQWLLRIPRLTVYSLANCSKKTDAQHLAKTIGLHGLIFKAERKIT